MAEKKYMGLESLNAYDALIKAYIDGKIFVGTYAEYQNANANGEIAINAIVIITDDENNSSSSGGNSGDNTGGGSDSSTSTTSVLGIAVLGQMVLG